MIPEQKAIFRSQVHNTILRSAKIEDVYPGLSRDGVTRIVGRRLGDKQ